MIVNDTMFIFSLLFLFIVYLESSLALLILIIACINYINITTARSSARAREVGVRKAIGAGRVSLIRQFLCESMVITMAALFIALGLIELFLPAYNNLLGIDVSLISHLQKLFHTISKRKKRKFSGIFLTNKL